jgi:hypothetical protein
VKGAVAHATGHRRRNPGVAEHNLLGLDAGFRLLHGGGGDVALHPGVSTSLRLMEWLLISRS